VTTGALTVGPLRPVVLKLAAPAVAMMACHFSFNLIDSIWVGRLIGPAALAAVSTAGFYVWVLLSLGEMVEVGLIALAARRHGQGAPEAAARAAGAAVIYALVAGAVVSVTGLVVMDGLFRLMTVPPDVARLGHQYLSIWLLGGPLVFGFFAIEATFRSAGDTRTPFFLLGTSILPHHPSKLEGRLVMTSLDHAMWFHRPLRMDDWLLYDMESPSASGARGFARAGVFARDGRLVATIAQEGLVRIKRGK